MKNTHGRREKSDFYETIFRNLLLFQENHREELQAAYQLHRHGTCCFIGGEYAARIGLGLSDSFPENLQIIVERQKLVNGRSTPSAEKLLHKSAFKTRFVGYGKVIQTLEDGQKLSFRPVAGLWWLKDTPPAEKTSVNLTRLYSLSADKIAIQLFVGDPSALRVDASERLYASYVKRRLSIDAAAAETSERAFEVTKKAAERWHKSTDWSYSPRLRKYLSGSLSRDEAQRKWFPVTGDVVRLV